jgi:serine/threonine protein kinase
MTAEQLIELIKKSGLVAAAELDEHLRRRRAAALTLTPVELADALVRDDVLTLFQARQLLQGRHKNFVLSGKYKILQPLGAGGMGQVFLCEHAVMHRQVAIKMLPPAQASDPAAVARFHREVRAVARLAHPNIVTAHDADRDGSHFFLVMEYIDGQTLHHLVKRGGAVPPHEAAHYTRQAALGLQHAHEHGLVHRDIKPRNLLVDLAGTVKVLDLGLARFFHDETDDISRRQESSPLGTTDYMAPEQAVDSHAADIRADIYSLGATFYFLLAGHSPFQGMSTMEKILSHQTRQPRPIRDLRPEVPAGMAAVLERMMAKDPRQRYQVPADVASALAPYVRSAPPRPGPPVDDAEPTRITADEPSVGDSAAPFDLPQEAMPFTPPGSAVEAVAGPPVNAPGRGAARRGAAGRPNRRWVVLGGLAVAMLAVGVAGGLTLRQLGLGDKRTPARPDPPVGLTAAAAPRLRLLVPAYFYPGGDGMAEWERLLKAPNPEQVVIIANPDSGPGKVADPNFIRVIDEAKAKGFLVIGYVSTRYAKRPPEEVKEEVDRWGRLYPGVQGIFFDEQVSAADRVDYYAGLYEHARKQRGLRLVVNNPGTICAEEYLSRSAADVVCLVESAKEFSQFHPPAWVTDYPAGRFAATICNIDDPMRMKQDVLKMADKHVGLCYLTNGTLPNPWNRLPSYWEAELAAVRQANERKAP